LLPADDCRQAAVVASLPVVQASPVAQQVCSHRAELAQDEPAVDSNSAAVSQRRAVLLAALPGEHSNFRSAGSHRYPQVSPEAQAARVRWIQV